MITPGPLARFQDDFAAALFAGPGAAPARIAGLAAQPAFAVYRNTVMKGCIDALQANYPAVTRLVGEEWLRAAAAAYVRDKPPAQPVLADYGADFPDFLAGFAPAATLGYLPAVARLDRCWTECHIAPSAAPLDSDGIGRLAPDNYFRARLEPHPAARWNWCADAPAWTIWSRNRSDTPFDGDMDWQAEGALLTRPGDAVLWRQLDRGGCAFLDVCAAGGTIAEATLAVVDADPAPELGRLVHMLLEAGAFARLHFSP